jgi:hypothetical protein
MYEEWVPAVLMELPRSEGQPPDNYEIYANPGRTHFVSLNTTQEKFRILRREIVAVVSEWHPSTHNYV